MLMARIEKFEDLEIWQLAREFCSDVYTLFLNSSLGIDYPLRNKMDKSSGSIMDNIAEGFERKGNEEFIQYLSIAKASCGELRSQLYRSLDRNHINQPKFNQLIEKLDLEGRKIGFLMTWLRNTGFKGSKLR